jgi:hypothetical protein
MGRLNPTRVGVSFALAALAFVVSYIAQRLWAASGGAVDARQVVAATHIPYFDRLRMALAHALTALCLLGMGLPDRALPGAARGLPALTGVVVLFAILVAGLVP